MEKSKYYSFLFMILFLFIGCKTGGQKIMEPNYTSHDHPMGTQNEYIIQSGDVLNIKFYYNPELNEEVVVRPDGRISLQLLDDIVAKGLSPKQLDEMLTRGYETEITNPSVTVIIKSFGGFQVFVGGEVNKQGLIQLLDELTPLQAILNAGGLKETANPGKTLIIRKGPDNKPETFEMNLYEIIKGNSTQPNILLQPCDVVYVPKTGIALANKFVEQYIQNLLLFRGVNFGFSYRLNDDDDED